MTRPARILPGPRCGWSPDPELSTCRPGPKAHIDHVPEPGERRAWGYHDVQCQVPNPRPGPHLDGYPECGLTGQHAGDHDYVRHAAEGFLAPGVREAACEEPEPEPEIEIT